MSAVLKASNQAFPQNQDGLNVLYQAAVGRKLPAILKAEKERIRAEVVASIAQKDGSFMESDLGGAAGVTNDADDKLRNEILAAGVGKSQI